ncbi:hypothetical protein [Synechococcus sp. N5]|uniref:hypothetical protein n=1 Tax=Synechococcus sp. N5 TaxID=2575515 RepID=UPI000E0F0AEB|nr:hypothetical protein [Synechococcus sp. N5]
MTPPPQTTVHIRNRDRVTGNWHVTNLRALPQGPIRRTVGTSGDPITLVVEADEWPVGFDDGGDFEIVINSAQPSNTLTLSGYLLKNKLPVRVGTTLVDPDGTPAATQYRLMFENRLRAHREGYGGLIREKTFNALDENGFVDPDADDYKTIQELVELALSSMGLAYESAPAELDTALDGTELTAPGPMDWGNARPVVELETILGSIGWTLVQLNDGSVAVRRLRRAGEPITIPTEIDDIAEPYALASTPAARANKIVITSGATRSITITKLDLSAFDWVVFDAATNEWVDQDVNALSTYQEGLKPGNADPVGGKQLAQLYRAVRLKNEQGSMHLDTKSRFINIPTNLDQGDFVPFAGSAGVVQARCATKLPGDQLKNTPELDSDPLILLEGLRAIPGAGVFVLPSTAEFVRVDGFATGRRGDARELGTDELEITFAHETASGDYFEDYFAICFEWTQSKGAISVAATDYQGLQDAMDDPYVVKVAVPFLRNVHTYDEGTGIRVTLNSEQIQEIARQYAIAYLSSGNAETGVIELRGIVDINPGDIEGAVTSVLFDVNRNMTVLTVNQHEIPRSHYEQFQRVAGRSITAGIGTLQLNRSSAARSDVRTNFAAEGHGGSGMDASPEGSAATRGRERSMSGVTGTIDAGPRPRAELASVAEMGSCYAMITGASPDGANKWIYDWEEVRFENGTAVKTGSVRKSSTHGKAINTFELLNGASGVQGNGVDLANLTGTFSIQPIPANIGVVKLEGPIRDGGNDRWLFSAPNGVDGACS